MKPFIRALILALALTSGAHAQQYLNVPSGTVLGRTQFGSGPAQPIPFSQIQGTLCTAFTTSAKGCVPAPGTTTGKFLGDDATWHTVSSSSQTITGGSGVSATGTCTGSALNCTIAASGNFASGMGVGISPPTADFYNYNASRNPVWYSQRDQVLSSGTAIADSIFKGQNASGTTVTWADNFAAVPYCRGKPSFGGFPCSTTTTTAGSEEGAFYVSSTSSNTITLSTNGTTTAGSATLNFASSTQDSGNLVGKVVADSTTPSAIPAGTYVKQQTYTTVVLSNNVVSPGVGSGDSITFTGKDMTWFDSNGVNIGGQRNLYIPAGQGVVSFDKTGTATYMMSLNSHGNDSLDFQSCNDVGQTCSAHGATNAMRFYVSSAGTHGPLIQLNYDYTITMGFTNGTASGTHALCVDASNRLVQSASGTCP